MNKNPFLKQEDIDFINSLFPDKKLTEHKKKEIEIKCKERNNEVIRYHNQNIQLKKV